MPHIIVTANEPTEGIEQPVMLRERVSAEDFQSDHFQAQLVERLGWAVGDAVEDVVDATDTGRNGGARYGVVEEYVGHGIGTAMHQPPDVLNYRTRARGARVRPGLCVAVEPMLTRGTHATQVLDDDWTVVTRDGKVACHWEHTVAVTPGGCWVLTAEDGGEAILKAAGGRYAPLGD